MLSNQSDLSRRAFVITLALGLSSVLFCAMLAVRIVYAGELRFRFFVWNLLLAWIPFACAFFAYRLHRYAERSSIGRRLLVAPLLVAWLAFFPNAPYVVTDFVHWSPGLDMLAFYDLVMILVFVLTGLMLGALSLYLAHGIVEDWVGRLLGWLFVVASCAAAGFGIYLGRFLRWNSWDILTNPDELFADILSRVLHPLAHARTTAFTLMMAAFVFCVYLIVNALANAPALQPSGSSESPDHARPRR